jgi:hypothetical protein
VPEQQWTFPRWGCLVIVGLCLIFMVWLPMRLLGSMASAVEVARVTSPDRGIDAVLVETNGGATTSFGYRVHLVPAGSAVDDQETAFLYAAGRSDCASGVNLRWAGPDRLVVEYLDAERVTSSAAEIEGRQVAVELKPGVTDPQAPCGGMEYNLRGRPYG